MALVRSTRRIEAPAQRVWDLVTDWRAHGRWIPLTVVTIDADSPVQAGLGVRFTGRTALGRAGFDDLMTVTEWHPPDADGAGSCRIEHRGRWVRGWAELDVTPERGGTRLTWLEELQPRWTPRFADPMVARIGRVLFDRTLRKLAAECES